MERTRWQVSVYIQRAALKAKLACLAPSATLGIIGACYVMVSGMLKSGAHKQLRSRGDATH